jgi:hypothetical protein
MPYSHVWMCCNRFLKTKAVAEFKDKDRPYGHMLMVGEVIAFTVVKYTHSLPGLNGWQRHRRDRQRAQGEVVMVRVAVFDPTPTRVGNLYTCATNRTYRPHPLWVPAKYLTAFLHVAPDRAGDDRLNNLVTIARN